MKTLMFCFPYAGGNSSIFYNWKQIFAPMITVVPVELPGKGRRFKEPPYESIENLVEDLKSWFCKELFHDFILFGHSLGAIIAFELARSLERSGIFPRLVVVSGCQPPHYYEIKKHAFHTLSDQNLIEELKCLNGTPAEILQNADLMKVLLPVLRADFRLLDEYTFSPHPIHKSLLSPIFILGGEKDKEVSIKRLKKWRNHTENQYEVKIFEGDHFFIHHSAPLIASAILEWLYKLNPV